MSDAKFADPFWAVIGLSLDQWIGHQAGPAGPPEKQQTNCAIVSNGSSLRLWEAATVADRNRERL